MAKAPRAGADVVRRLVRERARGPRRAPGPARRARGARDEDRGGRVDHDDERDPSVGSHLDVPKMLHELGDGDHGRKPHVHEGPRKIVEDGDGHGDFARVVATTPSSAGGGETGGLRLRDRRAFGSQGAGTVTGFISRVIEPPCESSLPSTWVMLPSVISVAASMVPTNVALAPSVTAAPTDQ